MALLINKPKRIVINTSVALTINRPELASMFASDAYWSNTANWNKVYFYYSDSSGAQNITVLFRAQDTQANFTSSSKVKQASWQLSKVVIQDYDRGLKTLYRKTNLAKLQECDFVVAVPNRAPSKIFLSNTSPLENQTFVGNLTATDPDILDPLTYTIVSGFGDAASFQVVGSNALHFVTAPNYEVKNQYSVKIRVTDSSDAYYEEAFTINVVDANDAPSNIILSSNTINENAAINTVIGTLTVTDEDTGATSTLALSGADAAFFNLNGNQLRSSAIFDYEAKASYSITITATDNAGATYSKNFNISVLNLNEAPTGITLSSNTIQENNSVNAIVGYLTTTDQDGNESFIYAITSGDTSAFNINGNQLRASQAFDFETKNTYTITIKATDSGGLTFSQSFSVYISNQVEAPTNISLSGSSINQYVAVNTVIGSLSATLPTSQPVSYSLVGGDVASFNINGTDLRSSTYFDYDEKSSYSVTVRGTSGSEYLDSSFNVNVNNNQLSSSFTLGTLGGVTYNGNPYVIDYYPYTTVTFSISDDGSTLAVNYRYNGYVSSNVNHLLNIYIKQNGAFVLQQQFPQINKYVSHVNISGDGNRIALIYEDATMRVSNQRLASLQCIDIYLKNGSTWSLESSLPLTDSKAATIVTAYLNYDGSSLVALDKYYNDTYPYSTYGSSGSGEIGGMIWQSTRSGSTWGGLSRVLPYSTFKSFTFYSGSYTSLSPTAMSFSGDGSTIALSYVKSVTIAPNTYDFYGTVQILKKVNGSWISAQSISTYYSNNYYFGSDVSLSYDGTVVAIGAENYVQGGKINGGVFIYTYNGSTWVQTSVLVPTTMWNVVKFGHRAKLNKTGDILATSAYGEDYSWFPDVLSAGALYIFKNTSGTWAQKNRILPPTSSTNLNFGLLIDFSSTKILVAFDSTRTLTGYKIVL